MVKYFLVLFFLSAAITLDAQTYNNEWINFNQAYFKFKVGRNGLVRIPQTTLATAGLGTTPVQNFQLWRNGEEVAIFTSVSSGIMGVSDYLEFYGRINDGKADKQLYKNDSLQMDDKWSLYTDSASYFLSVRPGSNKRIVNGLNNVAGNVLSPEKSFAYTLEKFYKNRQNSGYAIDYGTLLFSSSYETAEGWTSNNIIPGSLIENNTLLLDINGEPASFHAVVAGNASYLRNIQVKINGSLIAEAEVNNYDIQRFQVNDIPISTFSGGNANIEFVNPGAVLDKLVVSSYQLTYPRLFDFGGQTQFNFELPAGVSKYIEIVNFNFGGVAPVLLDLTHNIRTFGNLNGSQIRFVIPALDEATSFVLLNVDGSSIRTIDTLIPRVFINHSLPANQGDYIIISHPALFDDGAGNNNIEKYRAYRSSPTGGGFTAIVADINELTDQFAFGIKHHPAAVRNFGYYVMANFATPPQYFYLIGKGLTYVDFKKYESDPNVDKLALVPTFGYPASDNLLLAERTHSYSQANIGRLSAINGTEVGDYLEKVKQFELAQNSGPQTNANKGWMKNVAHITGAIDDISLSNLINYFMGKYKNIISDTAFGGKVYSFNKNSGQYTALGSAKTIDNLFHEGLSYLTYFGHSSPNTLEFNLDNPQNYDNTGKYPLIMVNGCNSGNLFLFDTLRPVSKGTLSEKYIFAKNKGSIAFIADTHFGLPQQLDFFTSEFDKNISNTMYGQSMGQVMRTTTTYLCDNYTNDYATRIHAEEITYHGDPALKLNPFTRPDYTIEDSLITFSPPIISLADQKIIITAKILNIGKAINDSIDILVQHKLPDNTIKEIITRRIRATLYEDTIQVPLFINPLHDKGLNTIIITIDPAGLIPELSETNNSISKTFNVIEDEIRPVFPFEYSIVHNGPGFAVYGSTANPLSIEKEYVMEMDTTMMFNSPSKISRSVIDSGGAIKFIPGTVLIDSTVYYWRLTTGPVSPASRWLSSSFTNINGSTVDGYAQSHYFQFKDDSFESINIDSATRKFTFDNKTRKLFIRTGLSPYYLWDQINVNVDNDQLDLYGCTFSLQFVIYNPLTLKPWRNYNVNATEGRYGSSKVCQNGSASDTTRIFFEYQYNTTAQRLKAMNFFDSIPAGYIVSVSNLNYIGNSSFINSWKADTASLGSGRSLWHKFHEAGLHQIDGFTSNLPFLFLFKKGDTINFPVRQHVGEAVNTQITDTFLLVGKTIEGSINSPWFGPVKSWKNFKWNAVPSATNTSYFDIKGESVNGTQTTLASVHNMTDTSISFIDAAEYPRLQIVMHNSDAQNAVPAQLKYLMLTADNYPEGAISPNLYFSCADTLTTGDSVKLRVAFQNISDVAFDSLKVRLTLTGSDGIEHIFINLGNGRRVKPLNPGDTAIISYTIPLSGYAGYNELKLEVNPDNDQPEQFYFNNILYKDLYVVRPACPGSVISFSVPTSVSNKQWQVNNGSGFTNISNGPLYSGVTTDNLVILAPTSAMYGYRYRCFYSGSNVLYYSNEFILKYTALWSGVINTAWEVPGNWSCGIIPDANTDVIIKTGAPNYPIISSSAICRSVSASVGSTVRVKSGFSLNLTGN